MNNYELPALSGKTIAVWFSCGAASAVAAKKTIEIYGENNAVRVINNPVIEEHEDNRRFLLDVEKWIGQEIEISINGKWPDCSAQAVWDKKRYMSGVAGAPCTSELKKKARQEWEAKNHHDYMVLGFTADSKEIKRHDNFTLTERDNLLPVLISQGITKADCFSIVSVAGIKRPEMYDLGYPNANCIGCVKATSPTYWNHVRKVHPAVFAQRARTSRDVGARLVRVDDQRIYLDELDPGAKGGKMNGVQCGSFCEELFPVSEYGRAPVRGEAQPKRIEQPKGDDVLQVTLL